MQKYTVTWTMQYEAEDPIDAALQAFGTVSDPSNTATIFEITDENGTTVAIDALEEQIVSEEYQKE